MGEILKNHNRRTLIDIGNPMLVLIYMFCTVALDESCSLLNFSIFMLRGCVFGFQSHKKKKKHAKKKINCSHVMCRRTLRLCWHLVSLATFICSLLWQYRLIPLLWYFLSQDDMVSPFIHTFTFSYLELHWWLAGINPAEYLPLPPTDDDTDSLYSIS